MEYNAKFSFEIANLVERETTSVKLRKNSYVLNSKFDLSIHSNEHWTLWKSRYMLGSSMWGYATPESKITLQICTHINLEFGCFGDNWSSNSSPGTFPDEICEIVCIFHGHACTLIDSSGWASLRKSSEIDESIRPAVRCIQISTGTLVKGISLKNSCHSRGNLGDQHSWFRILEQLIICSDITACQRQWSGWWHLTGQEPVAPNNCDLSCEKLDAPRTIWSD